MKNTHGFTLLELAVVLVLMGLLTVLAVPSFEGLLLRARSAEARMILETIVQAEHEYFRDHGEYLACGKTPPEIPGFRPIPFKGTECWTRLGITIESPVYYQYEVILDAESHQAVARGDLNGNGKSSKFTLAGATMVFTATDSLE